MSNSFDDRLLAPLRALRFRIRAARSLRGLCGGVLSLLVLLSLGFLFDETIGLGPQGFRVLLAAGIIAALYWSVRILKACLQHVAWLQLAVRVERRFPEFGERLMTVLSPDQAIGDVSFHAQILDETVRLTESRPLVQAYPLKRTKRLAQVTLGVLLLGSLAAILIPDFSPFARRLASAFTDRVYGFTLAVDPENCYQAKGQPLLVRAEVRPLDHNIRLPRVATLVFQTQGQADERHSMQLGDDGFSAVLGPVTGEGTYRVECGGVVSDTFWIKPVDPIALVPGGLEIAVVPPPYVSGDDWPTQKGWPASVLSLLQYSRLNVSAKLDQPARRGWVEYQSARGSEKLPITFSENCQQIAWTFLAQEIANGSAQLIVEEDHGIRSAFPLATWGVWKDGPPAFVQPVLREANATSTNGWQAGAGDKLRLRLAVEDTVGLGPITMESGRVGGATATTELKNPAGKKQVSDDLFIQVPVDLKTGESWQIRFQAVDNRLLRAGQMGDGIPARDLLPQVAHDPPLGETGPRWLTFQIVPKAEPLAKQEIVAQTREIETALANFQKELEIERQDIAKAKSAGHEMPVLTPEQARAVSEVRQLNTKNQSALREFARKLRATDALQPLSQLVQRAADKELDQAGQALEKSGQRSQSPALREQHLGGAEQAVRDAIQRLDELRKANEVLAQDRLRHWELEALAEKEGDLAKTARELSQLDPQKIADQLKKLQAEQANVAKMLEEWAEKNPELRAALAKMRQSQALQLAKEARALADKQRSQAKAAAADQVEKYKKAFANLAEQQEALASKASVYRGKLSAKVLAPEDVPDQAAHLAGKNLRAGDIGRALQAQDHSHEGFTRLAAELIKKPVLSGDPKATAKQLAEWQDAIAQRFEKLGKDFARLTTDQTLAGMREVLQGQKQLQQTLERWKLPAAPKSAQDLRSDAASSAGQAAEQFGRKEMLQAHETMQQTRDKLDRLAQNLPHAEPSKEAIETVLRPFTDEAKHLAKEQQKLQEATRDLLLKLLEEGHKGSGGGGEEMRQGMDKLTQDTRELAQKAGPEAKAMAEEAKTAAEMAQKSAEQSRMEQGKGDFDKAKDLDQEAALKLEMAGLKLEQSAALMGPKENDPPSPLGREFEEANKMVRQTQNQLRQSPAAEAMKQTADQLKKTARLAGDQMSQKMGLPRPSSPGGAAPGPLSAEELKSLVQKNWGELPGEVRARLVQDMRARYGEEYGAIIQRYFQQIAETAEKKR